MKRAPVADVDREIDAIVRGPRKCSAAPRPSIDESALTDVEKRNIRSKEAFEEQIAAVGLGDYSVRDLALFFGVKRSKLYERMCRRRTDLAPLDEWVAKLERHEAWRRLNAEFSQRSA